MANWREARRGKYSVGFKKRVVAEAMVPGASVANIARAHGLNGNRCLEAHVYMREKDDFCVAQGSSISASGEEKESHRG